jgi:hypothetical protein
LVGIKWFEITVIELDTNTSASKAIYKQLLESEPRMGQIKDYQIGILLLLC